MFTGIIQSIGTLADLQPKGGDMALVVNTGKLDMSDVALGDSIAVNGVCLTAIAMTESSFTADVSRETLSLTSLGDLSKGSDVNLEKALTLSSRLDGHIVQGHVDEAGKIKQIIKRDQATQIDIEVSKKSSQYLIPTGSIAINGVSLTITKSKDNIFSLVIIPHSFKETNISKLKKGDLVNVEYDFIAKYLYHFKKFPNLN